MIFWAYAKAFLVWLWRGLRAWFEVGRRLRQIEQDLQGQVISNRQELKHLQDTVSEAAASERSGFEQVRDRLELLERTQSEQLASLDRALQTRVDEWARQLSAQINQLYAAVASSPIEVRKR